MNVLPVITRELRAEARSPFTYWLRVIGAGAVITAAAFFVLLHGMRVGAGGQLFARLHSTLQLAIWILVPLLTADCISRERREGTLGLLFLTPLKALDIVIAKSLAHGLRAVTLLLAVLPVIALPLLMGGVSWQQAVISLLLNGSTMCLALAAGLLASASSKSWVRALILAFCFATIFAICFLYALGWLFRMNVFSGQSANLYSYDCFQVGLSLAIGLDPQFFYNFVVVNGRLPPAPLLRGFLTAVSGSLVLSALALVLIALIAAWLTKRNWQERPTHPLAVWFKHKLCTPVVMLDLLQRWMKRKLDRNPIGWLEQRTWSGRLVIWGWFAVMISVYSMALTEANYLMRNLNEIHTLMGWLLLVSMAVNASTSFRRERETRVLELLLVSPLSEAQIILGRLRGLWGQFLPSMALLLAGWMHLAVALNRLGREFSSIIFITAAFASIPVIGLYFSLRCRNFLTALMATVVAGMVVPAMLSTIISLTAQLVFNLELPPGGTGLYIPLLRLIDLLFHPVVVQLGLAACLWWWMHRRLAQRSFATEST